MRSNWFLWGRWVVRSLKPKGSSERISSPIKNPHPPFCKGGRGGIISLQFESRERDPLDFPRRPFDLILLNEDVFHLLHQEERLP